MDVRLGIEVGEGGLPFENRLPLLFLDPTLGNGRGQQFCKPLNSGYQRFNRLTAREGFLG